MNGDQLFEKLNLQYRSNDPEYRHDFSISEDLEGEINISKILLKVLRNNLPLSDEEYIAPDGSSMFPDPMKELNSDIRIIITSSFEHLIFESFPDQILLKNGYNQNGKRSGKSIQFDQYRGKRQIKKIEISDLYVDTIIVNSGIEYFNANNLYSKELIVNQKDYSVFPAFIINKFSVKGYSKCITINCINCNTLEVINTGELFTDDNEIALSDFNVKGCVIDKINYIASYKPSINIEDGTCNHIKLSIPDASKTIILSDLIIQNLCIENYEYNDDVIEKLKIHNLQNINSLKIVGFPNIDSYMCVKYIEISRMDLNKNSIVEISNIGGIETFIFNDLNNDGEIKLNNIVFDTSFVLKYKNYRKEIVNFLKRKNILAQKFYGLNITDTNFKNTRFNNCELPDCIYFSKIDLRSITLSNSKFPYKLKSLNNKLNEKINTYQHLKKIFENDGDKESSNIYRSRELNSRMYKLISSKRFFLDFDEVLNLFLNSISNNHGIS